jgi:hypothetical protein
VVDGSGKSSAYPCTCGINQCTENQKCTSSSSSCDALDPEKPSSPIDATGSVGLFVLGAILISPLFSITLEAIIDAFTSTKFQNWIKGTRDKESTEPVLSFMDMKMKEKVKDDNGKVVKEYTPGVSNFLIYLSKFFPTVIWSLIQLGIVLVFAGIYMRFPCYDFVVPDEDTSCTGGYQEPTSTLKFETALWYSIVTMTTVGYGDFYAKSSGARWIAASQMWFAAMMANDIIAEGDDSKLIRKFICDRGLLKTMKKGSEERAEVHRLCGKDDEAETKSDAESDK